MYGLEGGIRNRADLHLAGCLPYLWRTVKYEEIYLKDYQTVPEVVSNLRDYFTFYNHERFHQALGYQTPVQVYRGTYQLFGQPSHIQQGEQQGGNV